MVSSEHSFADCHGTGGRVSFVSEYERDLSHRAVSNLLKSARSPSTPPLCLSNMGNRQLHRLGSTAAQGLKLFPVRVPHN